MVPDNTECNIHQTVERNRKRATNAVTSLCGSRSIAAQQVARFAFIAPIATRIAGSGSKAIRAPSQGTHGRIGEAP